MAREELRLKRGGIITPTAAPVSTFVSPGPDRTQELSNALGRFAEGYKRSVLIRDAVSRQDAEERAESLFLLHKNEMKNWQQTIQDFPELAGESPYFRYQLEGRMGDQLARTVTDQLLISTALMQSEDFDTDAGIIVDELASELGVQSEAFKLGFSRQLDKGLAQARSQNTTARRNESLAEGQMALADAVYSSLDEDDLPGVIEALESSMFVMDKTMANQTVAQAIMAYAVENLDVTVLDLMDRIPQKDGFMGNTAFARGLKERAERTITERKRQKENQEWTERGRVQTILLDQVYSAVMQETEAGEADVDLSGYMAILNANGLGKHAASVRAAAAGRVDYNEPLPTYDMQRKLSGLVWDTESPLKIVELEHMFQTGQISRVDRQFGVQLLNQRKNEVNAGGNARTNEHSAALATVKKRVALDEPSFGTGTYNPYDTQLQEAAAHTANLRLMAAQEELAQMGDIERAMKVEEIVQDVVRYYRQEGQLTKNAELTQDMSVDPIFRDMYWTVENNSKTELMPETAVLAAIPTVQSWLDNRSSAEGDASEYLADLYASLPPEVQTYIDDNPGVKWASDSFLMLLWGQRKYHKSQPRP